MPVSAAEYRSIGKSAQLPDKSVNPYYVDERKLRVSVARIGDKLFAFDTISMPHEGCQLSAGILTGTTLMCVRCTWLCSSMSRVVLCYVGLRSARSTTREGA